jgi:hypothetical protein
VTDAFQATPLPTQELAAPGTNTATINQPVALFRNFYDARVETELVVGLKGLYDAVAPKPAVYSRKKDIPLFVLAAFRIAPYIGKTAQKYGPGPGKQRSNEHIETMGPRIAFDFDAVPVQAIADKFRNFAIGHIAYESFSSESAGDSKVVGRGRVIVFLDGMWPASEHKAICEVINRVLFNSAADRGAFPAAQGFAILARRHENHRPFADGARGQLLSLAKIRALVPPPKPRTFITKSGPAQTAKTSSSRKRAASGRWASPIPRTTGTQSSNRSDANGPTRSIRTRSHPSHSMLPTPCHGPQRITQDAPTSKPR